MLSILITEICPELSRLVVTSPPPSSPPFHLKVMSVAKKENLADELKWCKFSSVAWTHDHKGFFYQVSLCM